MLFTHNQSKCKSTKEYLALCDAFIGELADFVDNHYAQACVSHEVVMNDCGRPPVPVTSAIYHDSPLYENGSGEEEQTYSTAYFAILIDVVLGRCRTKKWTLT